MTDDEQGIEERGEIAECLSSCLQIDILVIPDLHWAVFWELWLQTAAQLTV